MLDVYHWEPNGAWAKPLIALAQKGIEHRRHYHDVLEHIGELPVTPTLETANDPDGEGPLLVHDGRQVSEGFFAIAYLEDAFPDTMPLRPADAAGRAAILAWSRFVNERTMPATSTLGCRQFLVPALRARDRASVSARIAAVPVAETREGWRRAFDDDYPEPLVAECRRNLAATIARAEQALQAGGWLVGDSYSLADIDLFAVANSLPLLAPDLAGAEAAPIFSDWLQRIRARPAVVQALAAGRSEQPETAFVPGPEHPRWG